MKARAADRTSLYFAMRAIALMLALYGLYYYPYATGSAASELITGFLHAQAASSAALIGLFDSGVSASGTAIFGSFPLEVVRSCSSLDAQALYAATVLAFPSSWPRKLIGLSAGFISLTGLNIVRIASLYFVGARAPAAFDTVHEELFPFALIAVACVGFALWARWASSQEAGRAAA